MSSPTTKYEGWSRDRLIAELEKVSNQFGLRWDARQADRNFDEEQKSSLVVLNHSPELSVGEGPYQNLLIEGDNFDALRYLSVTHRGKVKCIYIDPPYNTGNNDFIYKDNFLDKEAPFRHSRWLAFMHARLRLAKDILAHDGVILVSIDDNEYHHLKMLMDQVFAGMYQATFVWKRRSGSNDAKGAFVSTDHEYVVCYAGKDFAFGGEKKSFENYTNPDGDVEPWARGDLTKAFGYLERPNTFYPICNPETGIWYAPNPKRVWWCATRDRVKPGQKLKASTMEELISRKKVIFPTEDKPAKFDTLAALKAAIADGTAPGNLRADLYPSAEENDAYLSFFVGKTLGFGSPGYKRHLSEVKKTEKPLSTWVVPSSEKEPPESPEVEFLSWGYTAEGTKLIQDMLGTKAFSYPKPLSLVKALVEQATGPGDLVVDFFGGSGTTGHAVLAINAENPDDEPRRFIVVSSSERTATEPDKNICRDVTATRLKAAVAGYQVRKKSGFDTIEGLGGGFAYLQAESLPVTELGFTLQDEQIWYALQLMQLESLTAYDASASVQVARTNDGAIAFCASAGDKASQDILAALAKKVGSVRVFTRKIAAAEAWAASCENIELLPVPQDLLDIFGVTE